MQSRGAGPATFKVVVVNALLDSMGWSANHGSASLQMVSSALDMEPVITPQESVYVTLNTVIPWTVRDFSVLIQVRRLDLG